MPRQPPLSRLLQDMEKEDLITEILKLCDKFDVVKKYFDVELSGNTTRILAKAKTEITRQFQTAKGTWKDNPKASNLNKIIKDFEQISIYPSDLVALLVHRVNETIRWAAKAYTANQALTNSTELAMSRARKLIEAEGQEALYAEATKDWDNPYWRYGTGPGLIKPVGGWRIW